MTDTAPENLDDLDCVPFEGGVDCSSIVARLQFFLDGELAPERMERVRKHLDGCLPCLEAFDFEAELRLVVQAKCREQLPAGLLERIATALEGCDPDAP